MKIRRDLYPQLKAARDSGNIAFLKKRKIIVEKRHTESARNTLDASLHTPQRHVSSATIQVTPISSNLQPQPSPMRHQQLPPQQNSNTIEPKIRKSSRNK